MASSDIDRFLGYFANIQHHGWMQTAYSSPSLSLCVSVLICAFSFFPVMLLNNGETACSSHAVTQPVKSWAERPAVNTYVHVCVCWSICLQAPPLAPSCTPMAIQYKTHCICTETLQSAVTSCFKNVRSRNTEDSIMSQTHCPRDTICIGYGSTT